ncbi:hypothetical protein GGS20DRAFT_576701 [Poronia punctata]|nr:hypothetical protein GGS20DRAFT_576701 [Poronia punctata]
MDQQSGIIADKVAQANFGAYRPEGPDNEAGPSTPGSAASPGVDHVPEKEEQQFHRPPPYSSPSTGVPEPRRIPNGPQRYPGLPVLDYRQYSPPMFDLTADSTAITSKAPYLSENANALSSLIRTLATVPPKPQVLIQGTRGRKTDFSVRLNLMSLLVPEDPRDRLDYMRCVGRDELAYRGGNEPGIEPELGAGEDGLVAWCERFVKDPATVKSFTMERVVANLDHGWLEGQIRSLVASIEYKGAVAVSFPVTHARVTVQNPDKVNKFFTSVTKLFSGKAKYEVVKSVWPFANARNGEQGRKCIVQNEKTWWEEWRDPIKYAISQKRQGWITNEDKLECIMESKGKGIPLVDWGPVEEYY